MDEKIRVNHNFLEEMEEERKKIMMRDLKKQEEQQKEIISQKSEVLEQEYPEKQDQEMLNQVDFIEYLDINSLSDFPEHKFKLYDGERLDDMVKSILEVGILTPLLVWEMDGRYIILSGHNRKKAAQMAGLGVVPCVIKTDLSIDEATYIVTESNLIQRSFSDLTHSEKAYVLKQHYDAIKSQGIRKDIIDFVEKVANGNAVKTSDSNNYNGLAQNVLNKESENSSRVDTGNKYNLNRMNVTRYIKISSIQKSLMDLLDDNKLSFIVTYNLAFIDDKEIQEELARYVKDEDVKINVALSEKLKAAWQSKKLSFENLEEFLFKKKKESNAKKSKFFKLDRSKFEKYFDEESDEEIQEFVLKLLKAHFSIKKSSENQDESKEEVILNEVLEQDDNEVEEYDDFPDISLFSPNSEIKIKGETYYSLGGRWLKQRDYEFMKKSAKNFRNTFK